jgi:ABC-type Fe3+ transport system substrate-binding protein
VSGLAAQQPLRGTPAELEQKLEAGAIDLLAAAGGQQLHDASLRSAPVAAASVQPLPLQSVVASPLPAAAHPNAAALFTGFLVTEEGQQLWQDYTGQASIWYPPSATAQLVQGKQYVIAGQDFALGDRPSRTAKYAKLLGY